VSRNSTPKLGEWSEGKLYQFRQTDGGPVVDPESGKMITYTVEKAGGIPETLAAVYADGLQSVMAAMYAAGIFRGREAGKREAQAEMRRAIGV
jgi:hypothetical protein